MVGLAHEAPTANELKLVDTPVAEIPIAVGVPEIVGYVQIVPSSLPILYVAGVEPKSLSARL